jgi:hypothetical protein
MRGVRQIRLSGLCDGEVPGRADSPGFHSPCDLRPEKQGISMMRWIVKTCGFLRYDEVVVGTIRNPR